MAATIKLDSSAETVVATCRVCSWRAGPASRDIARALGKAHQRDVHPKQQPDTRVRHRHRRATG